MKKENFKVNVLFFIFNRPVHTETTLNELLKQKDYINQLFINVDYPCNKEDKMLQDKTIFAVNKILKRENFENVVWKKHSSKQGLAKSIVGLTNHYAAQYKNLSAVVIEDDCVPLPGFMNYMSYYLDKFKNDNSVYTVCGYQYKEDKIITDINNKPIVDVEKTERFNPWGWGFWPNKWKFEWIKSIPEEEFLKIPPSVSEFLKIKEFQTGEIDVWSTTVIHKQYTQGLQTIIPNISLIENIGFDGTGVHSEVTNVFTKDDIIKTDPIIIKRNSDISINKSREIETEKFLYDNLGKVMFNKKQKQK